jgi:hypothetical protein
VDPRIVRERTDGPTGKRKVHTAACKVECKRGAGNWSRVQMSQRTEHGKQAGKQGKAAVQCPVHVEVGRRPG